MYIVLMIPSGTADCGFDKSVLVHCGLCCSRGLGRTSEGLGSVGDSYTNLQSLIFKYYTLTLGE